MSLALFLAVPAGESAGSRATRTKRAGCGPRGFAYAGLTARLGSHGIRADLTAPEAPAVESGYVAGWVGVGGPEEGPNGADEWLQVGYNSVPGSESKLYYEVVRPGAPATYVELDAHVAPRVRHRLAVLEMSSRPNHWRVWVDGRPVSAPILLPDSRWGRLVPMAQAERWDGGKPACNTYTYCFEKIVLAESPGGRWRALGKAEYHADTGTRIIRGRGSFTAIARDPGA